jgi:hypothetical protein
MDGTAIETCAPVSLGAAGWFIWLPVCRCWVATANTAGYILCPLHGYIQSPRLPD